MRRRTVRVLGLVLVLLVWLVVAAWGGVAQGELSQVQENDDAAFLPESAESTRAAHLAEEFTGEQTLPALVVVRPEDGGKLDRSELEILDRLASTASQLELPNGRRLSDVARAPVVAVPAPDGAAALLTVALDGAQVDEVVGPEDEQLGAVVVDELRALTDEELSGTGLQAWVTGPAGFVADLGSAFGSIDTVLLAVALSVVLVILLLVYRSPLLPFTVLLTSVLGLCAAALVVKNLAERDVLLLNGQSQGILSILVVGAATDYSLLLIARYREELESGADPTSAMRAAWRASLEPILASAGTVVAGLLCLLLSDLRSNSGLGPVAAIGICCAVLSALTLLPALLLAAGRRSTVLFWPRVPGRAGNRRNDSRLWPKVADAVGARPRRVWVTTAVVLLGAAAFAPTFQAEGTSESDIFLNDVESVAGETVLAEHFDAGSVQPALVIGDAEKAGELRTAAGDVDGVRSAEVVTAEDGAPLTVDGRVQVEVALAAPAESNEAVESVDGLREAVHAADPQALVGGAAAERLDTIEAGERDLRTIVPLVLAAIAVLLALLLRAIVAPLVVLVANLLSFGATMGLSAVVFHQVLDLPGADPSVPLYGFVFLVALGIDYSIFLMTRVREESFRLGTRPGTRRGLAVTGGVITSAGLVLAATFGALSVVPLLFLLQLAFIVSAGVLIDTLLVRSLLVPGLVLDLGRRVWWPWQRHVPREAAETERLSPRL
ncbi:MMPL family transporter [Georgenia deserti]|uniref:MMPL family transporter n=1 Tax=Georgenia deserti TaxID=2093781 RepID=A0ABW4L644_9MICO